MIDDYPDIVECSSECEGGGVPIANNLISIPKSLHDIFISLRCYIDNNIININRNDDINEVFPNLFVSNYSTMTNKDLLKKLDINRIITVHSIFMPPHTGDFEYIHIPSYDIETDNLSEYFTMAYNLIDDSIKYGRRVLVHCYAGRSRSVSIALVYIFNKLAEYYCNGNGNINYIVEPPNKHIINDYVNGINEHQKIRKSSSINYDINAVGINELTLSYVKCVIGLFQEKRQCASPNPHFVELLCNYVKTNKLLIEN